jgi:dipeptidyl aminopeptidase/acylaminoacyl peptidase
MILIRSESKIRGKPMPKSFRMALAVGAALLAFPSIAAAQDDTAFLRFPLATTVSAADAPAFAWLIRQGSDSIVMFARAPKFERVKLFSRTDADGQPITDVRLSPDGRYVVFQTAAGFAGERAYNPASLIDPPKPTLWSMETRVGAKPVQVGPGQGPMFSPDGRTLIYRHGRDLLSLDLAAGGQPKVMIAGGAAFGQPFWTKDGKGLIFVSERGGYSFIGQYALGGEKIQWLVTGADRLGSPALSPDGKTVAYLRFGGREHGVTYDMTESEPFAVETVEIATGATRTLWQSKGQAVTSRLEDGDNGLRWVGDDNIVFYSEQDGWGRLYAIGRTGGEIRGLTPTGCEAAESEPAGTDSLFVVHNCRDIDTRQLSIINVRTGAERQIKRDDIVMANAVAAGDSGFIGLTGGDAENAPLVRVLDLKTGATVMAEKPADYGYSRSFAAPAPKAIRIKAADGGTVPAQLFMPAGKGPHPALVYVHGGPSRQMYPAFHYSDYYANDFAMNRRLAEQGYVVVAVNYRSGIGYGRAFREAEGRGWRAASEYNDVLGVGRWLAARDDVDRKRIGIWGGSYGGLLTGQALARDSGLFSAGVAIHGVFDWSWPSAQEGHLNPSRFFGVSEANRPTALKASPLGAIDGWRSPVLLFSGDQDMNVDVRETVDLAQKLKARNVDVRTVILPGEAHGFVRHESWVRLWHEQDRFLNEKLGGK